MYTFANHNNLPDLLIYESPHYRRGSPLISLSLAPIRYRRMADQISAAIRESIATGRLAPGTHLLEVEIAREMQTSRVPVREALMQLHQEGLVIRKPNCGTFVAELTEKMVREVCSLRSLLEGFAASLAARHLTTEDFTHLDALLKSMRIAAEAGDFSRVLACDYEFHKYIMHAAGHDLLEEVWRTTDAKIRVYLSATNLMRFDMQFIAESHRKTLAVLRTGNPKQARRAMAKHIKESLDLLVTGALSKAATRGANQSKGETRHQTGSARGARSDRGASPFLQSKHAN